MCGLCRKIMSLTIMPKVTVFVDYNEIRNNVQQLRGSPIEPLLNFFEKQWLSDISLGNISTIYARTNNVYDGKRKTESISKVTTILSHSRSL